MREEKNKVSVKKVYIRSGDYRMKLLVAVPEGARNAPGILWIHGGGYATGMSEMLYFSRAFALAKKYGAVVVSPEYRLSIKAPYPAALKDCYNALLYLKKHADELGVRNDQLMVGGESAGGGLCAAVCMLARDRGEVNIAYQMPLYPMIDDHDTASSEDNHAPVWNTKRNHQAWNLYLGKGHEDKDISPYGAPARQKDYKNLPPCYTFVGDIEPFTDETITYVENLKRAGVEARMDLYTDSWPGCFHAFDLLTPMRKISKEAIARFEEEYIYAVEHYHAPQKEEKMETKPTMGYRKDKYGNDISMLGYGCMRFTQKAGKTDKKKTETELMEAIKRGVNYFDTAYIYGQSEAVLGEILEKNKVRDQIKIATKLPHYLIKSVAGLDKTFNEQLKRLRTDRIDYYLMHMLTDVKTWDRLKEMGIEKWIEEKKANGQIKQIGFSYHGNPDMFKKLIDAYDWDFCQIQYNYMDEHSQAGRTGLEYAKSKNIPVVIMEPLRGGKLVNLPDAAKKAIAKYPVKRSAAEWSFDWLWNQEGIMCVLSGMNSLEMVIENCESAARCEELPFTEKDMKLVEKLRDALNVTMKVGCTGCRYCMPCPKNVDIPGIFAAYNRTAVDGKMRGTMDYFMCTGLRKDSAAASNCVKCGKCEKHCPQHIEIRKELDKARKELEGPVYKIGRRLIKTFKAY